MLFASRARSPRVMTPAAKRVPESVTADPVAVNEEVDANLSLLLSPRVRPPVLRKFTAVADWLLAPVTLTL